MEIPCFYFAISQLSSTFVTLKQINKGGDRPPRIRGADFLYLSGNDIGRYTACTPVYML